MNHLYFSSPCKAELIPKAISVALRERSKKGHSLRMPFSLSINKAHLINEPFIFLITM